MANAATDRVRKNTDECVNGQDDRRTLENVARFAALGDDAVDARLDHLDREWDIERILQASAAGVSLGGLLMGAIDGWCQPVPVLRRLGFRTQREIDDERTALKALRGDFVGLDPSGKRTDARRAWDAARA